jgi:hypothetical protein
LPGVHCNAQLRGAALRELTKATPKARGVLAGFLDLRKFSARAHDRVLKLARTIADINGSEFVDEGHVEVASQFRCLDQPLTGRPGRNMALQTARHVVLHKSPGKSPAENGGGLQ